MKYNYNMIWNGYTICSPDWGMEKAIEVFHRIYYIYGGEAYCEYNGENFRLEAGKLYIFPVMQPYTMWHNIEDPLDVLWFHIEMKQQLCTELICLEIEKDSVLGNLLEAMKGLSNSAEYFDKLQDVFSVFLDLLGEKVMLGAYPGKKMNKVLEYIEENIGKDLSVEMLADYIGMERSYFSRKFKQIFRMPPNQYLMAKKMSVAALELIAGASVYQAAAVAGYRDEKAFSRAFKSYMEITPAKYRDSRNIQP